MIHLKPTHKPLYKPQPDSDIAIGTLVVMKSCGYSQCEKGPAGGPATGEGIAHKPWYCSLGHQIAAKNERARKARKRARGNGLRPSSKTL